MGLVNKSLLRRHGDGRFEIHELLRQYAEERLTESDRSATLDSYSTYYLTFLAEREEDLFGAQALAAETEIGYEIQHIYPAWDIAIANAKTDLMSRSLDAFCQYLWATFTFTDAAPVTPFLRPPQILETH